MARRALSPSLLSETSNTINYLCCSRNGARISMPMSPIKLPPKFSICSCWPMRFYGIDRYLAILMAPWESMRQRANWSIFKDAKVYWLANSRIEWTPFSRSGFPFRFRCFNRGSYPYSTITKYLARFTSIWHSIKDRYCKFLKFWSTIVSTLSSRASVRSSAV